jgi:hypothetical protein
VIEQVSEEVIRRFHALVIPRGADECWPCQQTDAYGYGRVRLQYGGRGNPRQRVEVKAHRLAWELTNGPIPEGMCVCHTCDNPPCCNPEHLFIGTQADNDRDRDEKGRTPRGEHHSQSKLTVSDVRAIRRMRRDGHTYRGLAAQFNVTNGTISALIRGATWTHVKEEA